MPSMQWFVVSVTAAVVTGVMVAGGANAQATLDSPPNLSSWTAVDGGFQFNLLHRFSIGPAPSRKLQNSPTATLAYGLTSWLSAGVNYASASEVVLAYPNEWEFLARIAPLTQDGGAPFDLYLQGGYNLAAESVDGQVLLSRRAGPVRAAAGVGVLQDALYTGTTRATLAAGATVRVKGLLGLAADASTFADREASDEIAWSAGINIGVGGTPHTMSIHATNVASRTLQGIARGTSRTRYGFEYTIPISLGGYQRPPADPKDEAQQHPDREPSTSGRAKPASIDIRSLRFAKGEIEVAVGTAVVWRNRDPLSHTVTSDKGLFDSGEIGPDGSWSYTFNTPGRFSYHCAPHPAMKAVVVVRPTP